VHLGFFDSEDNTQFLIGLCTNFQSIVLEIYREENNNKILKCRVSIPGLMLTNDTILRQTASILE